MHFLPIFSLLRHQCFIPITVLIFQRQVWQLLYDLTPSQPWGHHVHLECCPKNDSDVTHVKAIAFTGLKSAKKPDSKKFKKDNCFLFPTGKGKTGGLT